MFVTKHLLFFWAVLKPPNTNKSYTLDGEMVEKKKDEESVDESHDESNTVAYSASVTANIVLVVLLLAVSGAAIILLKKKTKAEKERSGLNQGSVNHQYDNHYDSINETTN